MCRVLGYQPSLGMFHRFYINSISNGWLSFLRRDPTPCCFSKKFDSLKGWNDHFFWIDASICPIFVSWYNDVPIRRDSLPSDNLMDFELLEKLNNNRTVIQRYPETFMCLIGLSRSFDDPPVRPTLLKSDESGGFRLLCVHFVSFIYVKIGERTLAEDEVPLITETTDMVVASSAQTVRLVDHTIIDELEEHAEKKKRKSPSALKRLELQSGPQGAESGYVPCPAEEFVSSFVTPTPEPAALEDSGSTQDVNVQTRHVPDRFVVTSSSSEHGDTDISLRAKSPPPHAETENIDAEFTDRAGASSILGDHAKTSTSMPDEGSPIDEFFESQTLDSATTQDIYAALRNQPDARFLDGFNINSAQHACMVFELRLRYEHEIMSRERFQKKFTKSSAIIHQRDAETVALKAKLETTEKESAEVSRLRGRMSELEAEVVAKSKDITCLNKQNVKLLGKVPTLEAMRDELSGLVAKLGADCEKLRGEIVGEAKMREEFMSFQDVAARRFKERSTELDARLADCAQSSECHSALGKVISLAINKGIQQDLEAGIEHGKAGRTLAQELEALKDSPLALIMSALTLKSDADSTFELRPGSISHGMLLSDAIPAIHGRAEKRGLVSSSSSTVGGVVGVVPAQDSSLGVADYQISTWFILEMRCL
ncbi:hypothetical protein Tco_0283037 [Tanacetum coccineum]